MMAFFYKSVNTVLFDLDGTLVDSAPEIHAAINSAMEHCGLPGIPEQYVRNWVGLGTGFIIRKLLTDSGRAHKAVYSDSEFEEVYDLFLSTYRKTNGKNSFLYPLVHETLTKIKGFNIKTGIVTNRPAEFTESLISQFELDDLIDTLVCADQFGSYKPEPDMLLHAVRELGGAPGVSVMVGDSMSDLIAAKKAGIMSVYARYGHGHDSGKCEHGADVTIDSFADLCHAE